MPGFVPIPYEQKFHYSLKVGKLVWGLDVADRGAGGGRRPMIWLTMRLICKIMR
jgi:hypothetical protein